MSERASISRAIVTWIMLFVYQGLANYAVITVLVFGTGSMRMPMSR